MVLGRGHHRWVATPDDHASARMGESIYRFALRELPGGIRRAWQLESARLAAQGRRLAAEGVWVIMFPEGTRTARGEQGVYKSGASRLAIATGVPIVPIAVSSARCWPRRSFLLRPGRIDISIGPPIASAGREPDELMRQVEAWIETEMHRLDPEAYAAGRAS